MEVHSQTAPYLTFMGETLPNNAYVDFSLMMYPGNDDDTADISSTVICHTDLATCCRGEDGGDQGDWYFPDGDSLPGAGSDNANSHPITQRKRNQLVRLQRGPPTATGDIPDGIYRCDIETVAVNSDDNTDRETVYVGVYGSGGMYKYLECGIVAAKDVRQRQCVYKNTHYHSHVQLATQYTHVVHTCIYT